MTSRIICSIDDLTHDIKTTKDPIRRVMLKKFLEMKMSQMRAEADDPSLDGLSDDSTSEFNRPKDVRDGESEKDEGKGLKTKGELDQILKQQNDGLKDLDRLDKIKAYVALIDDNKKDEDQKEIEKKRGSREHMWESKGIYDPRYVKYQKEDSMNNRVMERLNSEIDFRIDEHKKVKIEKPFDDGEPGSTEEFARFDPIDDNDNVKYVPKKRGRNALGVRRSIRH